MYLGELIATLKAAPQDRVCPWGFGNPHSYRGYYSELAFEPKPNVRVADMLKDAEGALGSTYEGWKGGSYTMGEMSEVHLAFEGRTGEEIGPILMIYMLGGTEEELSAALDQR